MTGIRIEIKDIETRVPTKKRILTFRGEMAKVYVGPLPSYDTGQALGIGEKPSAKDQHPLNVLNSENIPGIIPFLAY